MRGMAIVAIPPETHESWTISSEKIPHLTLLFLANIEDPEKIKNITEYVEHLASTTRRIGLSVDRRGELGEGKADVLFFEKPRIGSRILDLRQNLLRNDWILEAYNSIEQYPEWMPHLTLGYPDTPAHKDTREYKRFYWTEFEKIAFWTGDFEGPEFLLNREDADMDIAHSTIPKEISKSTEDFLSHQGVKGMKWGVRKDRKNRGRSRQTESSGRPFQKGSIKQVSDDALRKRISRLQMEQTYASLTAKRPNPAKAFIADVIKTSVKSAATTQLTKALNAGVASGFAKAASNPNVGEQTKAFYQAMAKTKKG